MAAGKSAPSVSGGRQRKRVTAFLSAGAIIAGAAAAGGAVTAGIDAAAKPPSSPTGSSNSPPSPTGSAGPSTSPTGSIATEAMIPYVAAGIAPVLVSALAQPLAEAATSTVATPLELKDLLLKNVVAPFAEGVSKNIGDAVSGALLQWAGLTPSPPATPSRETVAQVQAALQEHLKAELSPSPELRAAARKARLTPDHLAAELADAIARALARNLADALVRLPSSHRLDNRLVEAIAAWGVTQLQLSRSQPASTPPSLGPLYTVQPGDSLWSISQRSLSPSATAHEIDEGWRVIYRDNRAIIGDDPDRIVPGQILHIPRTPRGSS